MGPKGTRFTVTEFQKRSNPIQPWPDVVLSDGTIVIHTVLACGCCLYARPKQHLQFTYDQWLDYNAQAAPLIERFPAVDVSAIVAPLGLAPEPIH